MGLQIRCSSFALLSQTLILGERIVLVIRMQLLCKHKIGLHSATTSHSYPVIRLPREFASLAGETAEIYQTEQKGKLTFVVAVGKSVGKLCANQGRSQLEERLFALEKEISELKKSLSLNEGVSLHKNETDGPGVIRTHDLRHVKATS